MSGDTGQTPDATGTPVAPTHLRAADYFVTDCEQREAVAFIESTHYAAGAPNTSVARHALRPKGSDRIVGVALWLPPTRNAALSVAPDHPRGVLALSRLCVAEGVPTNGASFLLGRSMAALDRATWPTLLTYADTLYGHTGAIYRATNWTCLGEVPGSDAWVGPNGERRGRKRGGRNLSVEQMVALGYRRLPKAPKVKFVHRATQAGVVAA